jgi:hypothetical protein
MRSAAACAGRRARAVNSRVPRSEAEPMRGWFRGLSTNETDTGTEPSFVRPGGHTHSLAATTARGAAGQRSGNESLRTIGGDRKRRLSSASLKPSPSSGREAQNGVWIGARPCAAGVPVVCTVIKGPVPHRRLPAGTGLHMPRAKRALRARQGCPEPQGRRDVRDRPIGRGPAGVAEAGGAHCARSHGGAGNADGGGATGG